MKVLLCTPYDFSGKTPGGISVWASNISEYQQAHPEEGVTLDVFPCTRTHYVNENTKPFLRLYYGIVDYLKFIKDISRKVKEEEYDVVHINTTASIGAIKDIVLTHVLRKKAKVFLHYHFGRIPSLINRNNWEWALVRKSIKKAYKAILMDHHSYEALNAIGIINIVEVANPYSPKLEELVEEMCGNTERKRRRVLYAGRVFRKKGVYELVEACSKIDNIELRLVGPYEETDKKNLLEIARHEDWITFVGPVLHEKVIKELLSTDIFVMPSYNEGFPNAVLECMITRTPIIVTPVGAIPDMLDFDNDPCGVKILTHNVDDITRAICSLIDNEELKQTITQKAYRRVKEQYSLEQVGKRLFNVWRS